MHFSVLLHEQPNIVCMYVAIVQVYTSCTCGDVLFLESEDGGATASVELAPRAIRPSRGRRDSAVIWTKMEMVEDKLFINILVLFCYPPPPPPPYANGCGVNAIGTWTN